VSSIDKLTIETPEQTALEFPLAGIGSRFLAIALDTLLIAAAILIVVVVAIALAITFSFVSQNTPIYTLAIFFLLGFSIQFGYFALFESLWNGQTPGKRWTHLRVIKDSGRPISAYDAILRNLLRIVDSLPSLYAIGLITMLISKENKRLGDYAAGTVVVHEKPLQGVAASWAAQQTSAQPQPVPILVASQITVDELQLIEAFLNRRNSLEPDVRRAMARQIADRFAQRLAIAPETRADNEKFLETLAEQRRQMARFH
jgi:uncharacterized RDD family membrane protein YckC